MESINELSSILKQYFNWNKARVDCLAQMIKGIITVKTVNLTQIALCFSSKSDHTSSYRRIQRFFQKFEFDVSSISQMVLSVFSFSKKMIIIMDRTNWKFRKAHLNLLVISIGYHGISIPIYWMNLARGGSSKTDQRIFSIFKILLKIGKDRIKCVLGDREFVGNEWFAWLIENKIDFVIRIKNNSLMKKGPNDRYPTPAHELFKRLKSEKVKFIKQQFWVDNYSICLSASRAPNGELLIVATPKFNRNSLKLYRIRWQIENLFSCLKTNGFNLEDTHLTDQKKLEKLFFIVTIAFCWSYLVGMEKNEKKAIKTKTHGRKSMSLFRYGYNTLRNAALQGVKFFISYLKFLTPLSPLNPKKRLHV